MNILHVYVASAVGIVLVLSIIICNQAILKNEKADYNMLRYMLIIVGFACFFDIVIFTSDGKPGELFRFLNMLGNTFTFLATIAICLLWNFFIIFHLYGDTAKTRHKVRLLSIPAIIMSTVTLINWFVPLVFTIGNDNVYRRTPLAYVFSFISISYILYSAYVHITFKHKKNIKFFPISVFLFPVFVGYLIQTFFYGFATGWVSVAIGLCNAFMSVQKESAYVDKLTGLLNRAYLFDARFYESMHSGIMIDINQFKGINDTYGHDAGDQALREVASILSEATIENGTAFRYAGDEFLIFAEDTGTEALARIKSKILLELDKINSMPNRRYQLSLSFGLGEYDPDKENFDEFVKKMDKNMYYDKEQYYLNHKELSRRKYM